MIPLAIPNISGNEGKYLQECVDTGFVSSVGPFVDRFEEQIAQAAGVEHGVAVSSGTTGLQLALTALGVQSNDLVLLPTFTFIASANAIAHCGAAPWLIDIDPNSWMLNPSLLEEALHQNAQQIETGWVHRTTRQRIAAIMSVDTLGIPADRNAIQRIANQYQLPYLSDSAAALGATYQGDPIAQYADASVFSFNGNKTLTCGGGGAVVSQNPEIIQKIKHLSTTARVGRDYDHDAVGYNFRMTNLQAAVGCAQLERVEEFVAAKRQIAQTYNAAFKDVSGVGLFPEVPWGQSACWFSGITLSHVTDNGVHDICDYLSDKGVHTRPFWKPIHLQQPYSHCPTQLDGTADNLWRRILTLPCSTQLTEKEQQSVIQLIHQKLGA